MAAAAAEAVALYLTPASTERSGVGESRPRAAGGLSALGVAGDVGSMAGLLGRGEPFPEACPGRGLLQSVGGEACSGDRSSALQAGASVGRPSSAWWREEGGGVAVRAPASKLSARGESVAVSRGRRSLGDETARVGVGGGCSSAMSRSAVASASRSAAASASAASSASVASARIAGSDSVERSATRSRPAPPSLASVRRAARWWCGDGATAAALLGACARSTTSLRACGPSACSRSCAWRMVSRSEHAHVVNESSCIEALSRESATRSTPRTAATPLGGTIPSTVQIRIVTAMV